MFTKHHTTEQDQDIAPRRRRIGSSHLMAGAAIFIALGGTSYAAVSLPSNSVGTKQIKKSGVANSDIKSKAITNSKIRSNAVTSSKVKDGSLLAQDFGSGELPAGPAGPQGPQGTPGAKGDKGDPGINVWAVVRATGTAARGSQVVSSTRLAAGQYEVVFNRNVQDCAYVVSQGGEATVAVQGDASAVRRGGNPNGIFVRTWSNANAATDRPFHLQVSC
ncbi:MAG: hypothetical protein AB7G37_07310 [Solirubrobacteraceae bacterium]